MRMRDPAKNKAKADQNQNRRWRPGTRKEYERHEAIAKSRGKCKGKTPWGTDCPANASPSGSGYCSGHEQQGVEVGEKVAAVRPCQDCGRNPAWAEGNTNWCKDCLERRAAAGRRLIIGEESETLDDHDYIGEEGYIGKLPGEDHNHYLDRVLTPNGVVIPEPKELTPEEVAERKRRMKEAAEKRSKPSPLLKMMEEGENELY
jgi:hypothetical protein